MNTKVEMEWKETSAEKCIAIVTVSHWNGLSVIENPKIINKFKLIIETGVVQLTPVEGKDSFRNIDNEVRGVVFAMARSYFSALKKEINIFEWIEDNYYNKRDVDFSDGPLANDCFQYKEKTEEVVKKPEVKCQTTYRSSK